MRPPKLCRNGDGRAFAVYPNSGGKRIYFGRYGTDDAKRQYQGWLSNLLSALASSEPTEDQKRPGQSIAELAVLYLAWCDANHSPGEARNNRDTIYGLLDPFCGELPAAKFGPNKLRQFQQHLAGTGRFARTTVNSHVRRVRRFFRWCQSRELVPAGMSQELATVDPLRRGRTPARETAPTRPVPRAVWEATLPFLRKTTRAMVQIQFWCGMRPGEVCSLRACDVDRSHEVWLYMPPEHKTANRGKTLIKAIPEPAQEILAPWLVGPADVPIFRTMRKRVYTNQTYGAAVRRAAERARVHGVNVPHWHPNQLRHAILTEIRDRLGPEAAQAWAGHSDSATTLIYTWTASARLRTIAAELGRRAS